MLVNEANPAVTIFMAAYNVENYIAEAIQSALDQTFTNFELLIVDDGSTDRTIEIIATYTDPRIRLLKNPVNKGLIYTRNIALNAARGTYIAILDSDDVASKNRLQLQYDFFQSHPDYALCGGQALVIDKYSNPTGEKIEVVTGVEKLKITLLFTNTYVNSSVMLKTAVLKELGGYQDFAPAEDYELFIRIADNYPIDNLPDVLVKYRKHEHNISQLQSELSHLKIKKIKEKQLINLGISPNKHLIELMFSLLMWDYSSFQFADYLDLFTKIKRANRKLKKYPAKALERIIFNRWFDLLYVKGAKMNALSLLFNRNLFNWSYVNARQLRKAFKLSLKGIGSISR